ncbi:MAG: diaminopimelate decarboxylase [Parasporobacterium sp.]|nr:diaminopimelate decarboxylase [Parasporobacterium sp.]
MVCDNISVGDNGHLYFAGQDTIDLAKEYGTPLYLMDEDKIREKCRIYTEAFKAELPEGSRPLYASKACSFKQIYRIMSEMGMGIDVVSPGEIYTAREAGFDLSNAYFHGNNKTDEDVAFAMDCGVGYFVADNMAEIDAIEAEAGRREIVQKVLLRITPGIDPHTYDAVATGKVDSKFGSAIETGQADEITGYTLSMKHIELIGFHCHVGSQVFGEDVFERAARVMLEFVRDVKVKYGFITEQLNLGGGYGVIYVASDPGLDIAAKVKSVGAAIKAACEEMELIPPVILMEPGRSIVADSGMTLYTAGNVKKIPSYKNYVSIDGGMTDNPRYALYGSKYTCCIANRMDEECDMLATIAGRCCESGDMIQRDVPVPSSTCKGDIVAVCTTGAYNYSMASNYNRITRPPVVMLREGSSYVAVQRESFEDLCRNDI